MQVVYSDRQLIVVIKPAGVLSTDENGGLPDLIREYLGEADANVRTVHRLDRVVSGLMVLARTRRAASDLSEQIRNGDFHKEYLAVVHGEIDARGDMTDLLLRDASEKKTYVAALPEKGAQEARLSYERLWCKDDLSEVSIKLYTGRTHQIRCQFSSRGFPLVGDKKYGNAEDECQIALWSHKLKFMHPKTGEQMTFCVEPPAVYPWSV